VEFEGEDGRRRTFDFADCEMPGWHQDLAAAVAARIGPGGGLRTAASALAVWTPLRRFLRSLASDPGRPRAAGRLDGPATCGASPTSYGRACNPVYALRCVNHVAAVLSLPPVAGQIAQEVLDAMRVRIPGLPGSTAGYSDGELRRLLVAARADVAALRTRIEAGRRLQADPTATDPATEAMPTVAAGGRCAFLRDTWRAAQAVFPVRQGLPSRLALMVAVTGRNIETIKELPAAHRIVEGKAVEVRLTKRRRGSGRWHEAVTWEIGRPGEELRRPSELYRCCTISWRPAGPWPQTRPGPGRTAARVTATRTAAPSAAL
jgi:hypothetical protein